MDGGSRAAKPNLKDLVAKSDAANSLRLEFFLARVKRLVYPKHFWRTYSVRIDNPPTDRNYAAFRETTLGSTRDLENSVLWKAICQLQSAIEADISREREGLLGDLLIPLD